VTALTIDRNEIGRRPTSILRGTVQIPVTA